MANEHLPHTGMRVSLTAEACDPASLPTDATVGNLVQVLANRKGIPLTQQNDLEKDYDFVSSFDPMSSTVSTSAVTAVTTVVTALAANAARIKAYLQVVSATNALYVKLGTGASSTSMNYLLKPASGALAGDGGFVEIRNWKGDISVVAAAGTVSVLVWEITA